MIIERGRIDSQKILKIQKTDKSKYLILSFYSFIVSQTTRSSIAIINFVIINISMSLCSVLW